MSEEREWVAQAQRGDQAAFAALMERHAQRVYNLALRMVRDPEEARDLAQETFLRAWRGLPNFQQNATFGTWLYRIVVNLCYNRLPRLHQEVAMIMPAEAAIDLPDAQQQVDGPLLAEERIAHLHRAIVALPDSYRLLITLRHLQGMSYNEIAQVVGVPLGTVKTGIHRARGLLRDALEGYERSL